jgi:hypothetical protein
VLLLADPSLPQLPLVQQLPHPQQVGDGCNIRCNNNIIVKHVKNSNTVDYYYYYSYYNCCNDDKYCFID